MNVFWYKCARQEILYQNHPPSLKSQMVHPYATFDQQRRSWRANTMVGFYPLCTYSLGMNGDSYCRSIFFMITARYVPS